MRASCASHAGDALFEACYLPEFRTVARTLRDKFDGSYDVFFERFRAAERFDFDLYAEPLETYAMAACYSPDEEAPGRARLPFEIDLDAGRSADYCLDLGAQAFSKQLVTLGVDHSLILFEGTHGGLQYRYPGAIRTLIEALA